MADSYYTSKGRTETQAIMLAEEPTGPNVPHFAVVVHPDEDAIFFVADNDPKKTAKLARLSAYQGVNPLLIGPYTSRELALAAQEE